ncbi:Fc.00g038910.m01.CDS01 [Cosmosporella sp. VM-42]
MRSQVISIWLLALTQGQGCIIPIADAGKGQLIDLRDAEEPSSCLTNPPRITNSVSEFEEEGFHQLVAREYDILTGVPEDIVESSATVKVSIAVVPTGTAQILPSLTGDIEPHTSGAVLISLNATGRPTELPLMTSTIPEPVSLLQPLTSTTTTPATSALSGSRLFKMAVADIFANPIDTKAPPSQIKSRTDHPVPRLGVSKKSPIETNKFYSNFFLGDQQSPTFTFPYSIAWAAGSGASTSWGMSCSHIEAKQRVFGAKKYNNAASYFINPIGIQSMVISAKELGKTTVLTTDAITAFSARINLAKDSTSAPAIQFPVVQGMSYITAQYNGATPIIQTGVYFKTMTRVTNDPKSNVAKYNFVLEDGTTWRVYAYKSKGDQLNLQVINNGLAQAKQPFYGIIQIAKDPKTTGSEALLDDGAGIYPTKFDLTGSTSGTTGTYTFTFTKAGHQTGNLYMYALPHHIASFNSATKSKVKSVKLQTTTKGIATLVQGTTWTMVETGLTTGMGFGPYSISKGTRKVLSDKAKAVIAPIAQKEVSQDMIEQTNIDSMYFSGKALAKFGAILYVINDMLENKALAQAGLAKLKTAFATFASNKQKYPLVYESAWGGIVSSASYATGNSGADFGNTYYNDHHFHYGYHILAAAYIGYLDPTWIPANKDYVNALVRDVASPSATDTYFPRWRNFDWFHGHSWAHGLFPAWDGKDQESSSEDMMATYAMKMWGRVTKNTNLISRSELMLAVQARSLQSYYLYQSDNTIQPSEFIGNKVAGILFENKIDHTTYFSADIEAIQGIHMIPILAPSTYIRTKKLVQEEWDAFFSNGRVDKINNGWKGILYANYATINPKAAWAFFSQKNFDSAWIDGGASLTWYLAYAAGLSGV